MPEDDSRVLAVMMKAASTGRAKTRLATAYAPEVVVALYKALVLDTIDLARALGLRTVGVCPAGDELELAEWLPRHVALTPQRGEGLADGLTSTFDQLCTPERRRVVALNGDSPHLPPSVVESAFSALTNNDLVVGPCDDGGYYLVGATARHPTLFDAEVMGQRAACESLLDRAGRLGLRTTVTATHYDVDLPADVARLARDLAADPRRAPRTAALLGSLSLEDQRARP